MAAKKKTKKTAKKKTAKKKTTKRSFSKQHASLQLTEEIIDQAVEFSRRGNFRYRIAQLLKVNVLTWNSWLDIGRKHLIEIYEGKRPTMTLQAYLVQELDAADSECLQKITINVMDKGTVRDQLNFAKMRFKMDFGPTNETHNEKTGAIEKVNYVDIMREDIAKMFPEAFSGNVNSPEGEED